MKYAVVTFGCRVNQADSLGFEEEGLVRGEVRMPSGDRDMLLMGLALGGSGPARAPAILRNE